MLRVMGQLPPLVPFLAQVTGLLGHGGVRLCIHFAPCDCRWVGASCSNAGRHGEGGGESHLAWKMHQDLYWVNILPFAFTMLCGHQAGQKKGVDGASGGLTMFNRVIHEVLTAMLSLRGT